MRTILLALVLPILATPALATDGVLEINQTCAVQTGCFAGDTAGFPVTITSEGSYGLTGNLAVSGANAIAVEIEASNITLDFRGFEIAGDNACSGTPVTSCTQAGSGRGVVSESRTNIEIRNGTVRNIGGDGIFLNNGNLHRVLGMRVTESGQRGIYVSTNAVVSNCSSYRNRFDGIWTATSARVEGNSIYGNGLNGIDVIGASFVLKNNVAFNGGDGVETNNDSMIIGNYLLGNLQAGIQSAVGRDFYGDNILEDNGSTVLGTAVQLGTNLCNGSLTCP